MATIGWIDFTTNDRNRIGSVLDLMRPEGMVDELGLGTIRDALANQLFPGISTIQTRAKYFFIVPYILSEYQSLKPTLQHKIAPDKYLQDAENNIMWDLAEKYNHEEGHGVIGISKKRGKFIARRPSAIFWNGINTYQFIQTNGLSVDGFLRQVTKPSMETLLSAIHEGDDVSGDDVDAYHDNEYKIRVSPKLNWKNNLTLDLDINEAEFFHDRILSIAKGKLIAELLEKNKLWNTFSKSKNFMEFANAAKSIQMSDSLKDMIILAHDFSELMFGAHLAYNCRVQQDNFNKDYYEKDFKQWIEELKEKMIDFAHFNPENLFKFATTSKAKTNQFVREWWDLVQYGCKDVKKRDLLIEFQEVNVKGSKARIRWNKNHDVQENKWLGLTYFDYRFNQAGNILRDIRNGIDAAS